MASAAPDRRSSVAQALGRYRQQGGEAEPEQAAAAGSAGSVKLRSGATLELPAGAEETRVPGGVPGSVGNAHTFKLPGGRRRLLVGELGLEGQGCKERLDQELERMKAAREDKDPERLKLRSLTTLEERVVAGHRVLFNEAMQGTSLGDAGVPFAAVASVMMCEGQDMLVLVYVSDEAALAPSVKPMLDAVVTSYRPAAATP